MVVTALVGLLAAAGSAQAGTTLVLPDGTERPRPWQTWVDRARVTTPDARLVLRLEECPDAPLAQGCSDGATIWLPEPDRFALMHEIGHEREWTLSPWRLDLFRRIMRHRRYDDEAFADAYAVCALGIRIGRREIREFGYGYRPTWRQNRRICRLL